MDIIDYNRKAWDAESDSGKSPWAAPVSRDVIERARHGEFSILLTNNKPVPRDWFPADLSGLDVLCLASGGGQQAPVLAAAGANVTSFDNSPQQLAKDREVSEREGLSIRTEQGDAADLTRFSGGSFDLIFHPVSNCFMPDIEPVWNEAFRVLRSGGVMLSGFSNGFIYIFDQLKAEDEGALEVRHSLPYSDVGDLTPEELARFTENGEPLEYGHTLDQQIGGQIRAGFVITGFYEDRADDESTPLNKYCSLYAATRAEKR